MAGSTPPKRKTPLKKIESPESPDEQQEGQSEQLEPQGKIYRFSEFQAEAERERAENPVDRPEVEPFVMYDVNPPIVITMPDSLDRILTIAELGEVSDIGLGILLPLLRALCGDQFPRVWELVKRDKDDRVMAKIVQAMMDHFQEAVTSALEAERDLPGGSEG